MRRSPFIDVDIVVARLAGVKGLIPGLTAIGLPAKRYPPGKFCGVETYFNITSTGCRFFPIYSFAPVYPKGLTLEQFLIICFCKGIDQVTVLHFSFPCLVFIQKL